MTTKRDKSEMRGTVISAKEDLEILRKNQRAAVLKMVSAMQEFAAATGTKFDEKYWIEFFAHDVTGDFVWCETEQLRGFIEENGGSYEEDMTWVAKLIKGACVMIDWDKPLRRVGDGAVVIQQQEAEYIDCHRIMFRDGKNFQTYRQNGTPAWANWKSGKALENFVDEPIMPGNVNLESQWFPLTDFSPSSAPKSDDDLRDRFAMAALTGNLAYSYHCPSSGNWQTNGAGIAEHCYEIADAMIAARRRK